MAAATGFTLDVAAIDSVFHEATIGMVNIIATR
jgi:hypothetical protein